MLVLEESSLEDTEEDKEDGFAGKAEAELRRGSIKSELLMMRRPRKLVILIAGILNDWSLEALPKTLDLTGGKD